MGASFEEWKDLGDKIKEVHRILFSPHFFRYVNEKKYQKNMSKAMKANSVIKDCLDNIVCSEFPDNADTINVFYGVDNKP